jgi:hypothetical protein
VKFCECTKNILDYQCFHYLHSFTLPLAWIIGMEGFSFVMPVTGLNRPNTGKEDDDDG